MPPPEQKHLKRYGIVNLRSIKTDSRLGFKYFTGKHVSSKKQVFVKTDPTSGQSAAREGAVLKILALRFHRLTYLSQPLISEPISRREPSFSQGKDGGIPKMPLTHNSGE